MRGRQRKENKLGEAGWAEPEGGKEERDCGKDELENHPGLAVSRERIVSGD